MTCSQPHTRAHKHAIYAACHQRRVWNITPPYANEISHPDGGAERSAVLQTADKRTKTELGHCRLSEERDCEMFEKLRSLGMLTFQVCVCVFVCVCMCVCARVRVCLSVCMNLSLLSKFGLLNCLLLDWFQLILQYFTIYNTSLCIYVCLPWW